MSKIMGIDIEKVDEPTVNKYLEKYEIGCNGRANRKIRILAKHLATMKAKMGDEAFDGCVCTTCGGDSPGDLDECPFCGDDETVDDDVEKVEDAPSPEPKSAEPVKPAKRSAAKNGKAPAKDKPAKDKPAKESKKAKPAKEAKKAKPVESKKAKPKDDAIEVVEGKGTKLSVPNEFGEADLDACVEEGKKCMGNATLECYRLGKVLKHIHDNNLYLLRKGAKGPMHASFKAFVRAEFQVSHQQAYNLMSVAAAFTEEQVKKLGISKLKLALQVPSEVREKILSGAEDGDSMSELSDQAKALLDKGKKDKPAKPANEGALTAVLAMGIMEEQMFCAPTKPGKVGQKTKPASQVKDEPFCLFQLENDVQAIVRVQLNEEGDMMCSLAFRRGETD